MEEVGTVAEDMEVSDQSKFEKIYIFKVDISRWTWRRVRRKRIRR